MIWSQDEYIKAWDFATRAHAGQTFQSEREGERLPYINHLAAVAMEVMAALSADQAPRQSTEDVNLAVQCALLHDTLEDTSTSYDELQSIFGDAVANGVLALTKNCQLPKTERMADSLVRIQQCPQSVWWVKLADRITNLSEPPFTWSNSKKSAYRQEAMLILAALASSHVTLATRLQQKINIYLRYIEPGQCGFSPDNNVLLCDK